MQIQFNYVNYDGQVAWKTVPGGGRTWDCLCDLLSYGKSRWL